MRPYDKYREFTPNPEGGARSNAMLFDNHQRQQKNSESRELHTWDHVLILNAFQELCARVPYFSQIFHVWDVT